jgi:hypothetical protein
VKALLTWPAPSPMSICIIIRQWAPCFMHEGKNAWTICPRPTWPRVNLCAMLPRPPRSSHSVSKLHTDAERKRKRGGGREDETVSIPARRNNSRDRSRSRKRKGRGPGGLGVRMGRKKNNRRFQVLPFTGSDLHANLPRNGIRGPTCAIISPRVVPPPLEIPNGEKLPFSGGRELRERERERERERKDWIISPEETSIHFDSGARRDNIREREHCFKFALNSARQAARGRRLHACGKRERVF